MIQYNAERSRFEWWLITQKLSEAKTTGHYQYRDIWERHQLVSLKTVFVSSRNAPRGEALRDETDTAAGETTS